MRSRAPFLCDTMVHFYQVNSRPRFSFFSFFLYFLTPVLFLLAAYGDMNESFVSVHDALDHASIKEGELQSLQTRLEEREGHIRQLEVLGEN